MNGSSTSSGKVDAVRYSPHLLKEIKDAESYLDSIRTCSDHMRHVVSNVLDLRFVDLIFVFSFCTRSSLKRLSFSFMVSSSRLESGNVLLSEEVVDPSRVTRQVISMMAGKALSRNITLSLDDSAMPRLASSSALSPSLPNLFISPSTSYRENNSARLIKGDSTTLTQIQLVSRM